MSVSFHVSISILQHTLLFTVCCLLTGMVWHDPHIPGLVLRDHCRRCGGPMQRDTLRFARLGDAIARCGWCHRWTMVASAEHVTDAIMNPRAYLPTFSTRLQRYGHHQYRKHFGR